MPAGIYKKVFSRCLKFLSSAAVKIQLQYVIPRLPFLPLFHRIRQKALTRRKETITVDRACRQETFIYEMVRLLSPRRHPANTLKLTGQIHVE